MTKILLLRFNLFIELLDLFLQKLMGHKRERYRKTSRITKSIG
jgi:hypothetical protein